MKNIKYLFAAGLLLAFAACSNDPDDYIVQADPAVTVSDIFITFTEAGGSERVAVATSNASTFTVDGQGDWLDVDILNNAVVLTASENTSYESKSCNVYINVGSGSQTARDSIYVVQLGASTIDLSAEGTANCYIARTQSQYRFDATLKGNGRSGGDGTTGYIAAYGLEVSGVTYADLLWESTFNGDKTASVDIIDGAPVYRDGYIHFQTGASPGNALIAAKNSNGDVLWSWHIWVVDDEIEDHEGNGLLWMDRNLGALTNIPGDRNNRGMFYQWGRKDPLLPTAESYEDASYWVYQSYNTQTGNGSGKWDYAGVEAPRFTQAPGNLPMTVKNPMTFIRQYGGTASSYNDWYIVSTDSEDMDSGLWGDDTNQTRKTIFDPCPPGYTVPPGDCWDVEIDDGTPEWTYEDELYGLYWTGGNGDYFPFVGMIVLSYGDLTYCGNIGMYWTSTVRASSNASFRLRSTATSQAVAAGARSYGQSVRCVRE